MNEQELRRFITAQPFKPFVIHTTADRSYPVQHPNFIFLPPSSRTAIVFEPQQRVHDHVSLLHIVAVEFTDADEAKASA